MDRSMILVVFLAKILAISRVSKYPQVPVDECLSPACIRGIPHAFHTAVAAALTAMHQSILPAADLLLSYLA